MSDRQLTATERRSDRRSPNNTQFEITVPSLSLPAECIDSSKSGLGLTLSEPIIVELTSTFGMSGKLACRRARLVNATRTKDGRYRMGFEFVDDRPNTQNS